MLVLLTNEGRVLLLDDKSGIIWSTCTSFSFFGLWVAGVSVVLFRLDARIRTVLRGGLEGV